ncbi:hypothetical protein V5F77_02675 [Xanthobacter sp. DSM 24535]|uniref:hypothetical protein n=1 Tax=Roseixanthobacter psychrophilus TaxID=3119917 RepID=UPI00372CB450
MTAKASGYSIGTPDMPVVLGMVARGDRKHDIAAWFGVNQGRIKQAENGKWGSPPHTPAHLLPPKGAPGIKGRRLRGEAEAALDALKKGHTAMAEAFLMKALAEYDANEA